MPARKGVRECRAAAKKLGGRFLGRAYVNQDSRLPWKCRVPDHPPFEQTYKMVRLGHWCKKCSGWERISVDRLGETARSLGGRCLSNRYVGPHAKYRWQCESGHRFWSRWNSVQQGHWCPQCGRSLTQKKLERYAPETVVRTLRLMHAAGDDVSSSALQRRGLGGLVRKMAQHYRSHDAALAAAGIDPEKTRKKVGRYSERAALAVLERLREAGRPLHWEATQQAAPGAVRYLVGLFGSYDAVLRKLREDPERIRRDAGTRMRMGKAFEQICEKVFTELRPHLVYQRRIVRGGKLLIPDAIDPRTNEWWDFKVSGWGMSARESIKDYGPHARRLVFICLADDLPRSDRNVVFRSVFEFERESESAKLRRLFAALRRLKKAKVGDRKLEVWATRWTRLSLERLIRSLPADRRNRGKVARRYSGAIKSAEKYGGWTALVATVTGASPRKIHKKYVPEDLVAFVRQRLAAGARINPTALAKENSGLVQVVDRRMGGIRKVLAQHGIDYDRLLRRQKNSGRR